MQNGRKPNTLSFYLYYFTSHLLPIYAVYILIVNNTLKSELLTSILIALWAFTVVILEIPSGVLADYWNKKFVVLIGQIAKLIACFLWMLSSSFLLYAFGFILWGISESFCSGAIEALLYEELEHNSSVEEYQRINGRCRFLMTAGITLGFLSGGILKEIDYSWIYSISICMAAFSVLFTFFIPYYEVKEKQQNKTSFIKTFFDALQQIRETSFLIRILLYCIVFLSTIGSIEEFLQLWLSELKIKGLFFGGLLVIIMLSQMIGSGLSSFLIIKKRMEVFLYSGMLICGILLIIGFYNTIISIITIITIFLLTGLMETKLEAFVQEKITGQRSTIFSINSSAMNLTGIVFTLIIGLISENFSFKISFVVLGLFIVIAALCLFISFKYSMNKKT